MGVRAGSSAGKGTSLLCISQYKLLKERLQCLVGLRQEFSLECNRTCRSSFSSVEHDCCSGIDDLVRNMCEYHDLPSPCVLTLRHVRSPTSDFTRVLASKVWIGRHFLIPQSFNHTLLGMALSAAWWFVWWVPFTLHECQAFIETVLVLFSLVDGRCSSRATGSRIHSSQTIYPCCCSRFCTLPPNS